MFRDMVTTRVTGIVSAIHALLHTCLHQVCTLLITIRADESRRSRSLNNSLTMLRFALISIIAASSLAASAPRSAVGLPRASTTPLLNALDEEVGGARCRRNSSRSQMPW